MIQEISFSSSFLGLLNTVAEQTDHKTSLAKGKFKQDYGNILYLTQNRTRANQLNALLAQEVAQTAEKAIIPPNILPYTAGFVQLAALAKFGYVDSLNVCRYSDEWFNLFLYDIAKEIVPESFFKGDELIDNKRANLAKDFRAFIRDAVLYLKTAELENLREDEHTTDTEHLFLEAYRTFRAKEKGFPNTENQFLHPLAAYEYLHKRVHNEQEPFVLPKVILAEDTDLWEPLFREILDKLPCPVYVLKDTPISEDSYKEKTDLYHFMTPLDEAEFIGWKIKKLLTQGSPATDIGVVCANRAVADILEIVFKRMDLAGEQTLPLAANGYYRLVKTLFALIHRPQDAQINVEELFISSKSKFKLGKGLYRFQKMLAQKGLQATLSPTEVLLETADEFIAAYQAKQEYKEAVDTLKNFKQLFQGKPSVSQIAEQSLNDATDKPLINDIMASLYELDENLKHLREDEEAYLKKADALFGLLDQREIRMPRQTLALEENAPQEEETSAPYAFSVVPSELAKTLRAKHLFLCGFNASADKIGLLCFPNALAEKLKLPTLADKKQISAASVVQALNGALHTDVTYPYLNEDEKEDGQSVLVQFLGQVLPKDKQHIGPDNHLLKSYEVINEKDMPDPSWVAVQSVRCGNKELKKFTKDILTQTQTYKNLLEEILTPDGDGRRAIAAKQFADFIICPTKFFFALLAKYCNMDMTDAQGIQRMSCGSFWHQVFETAAASKNFYSKRECDIQTALEAALEQTVNGFFENGKKKIALSQFDTREEEVFIAQSKQEIIPLFARNEAARQTACNLVKSAGLEEKFTYQMPNCSFDIHGKVDRKDKGENGEIFFWDYKTGNPTFKPIQFYTKKRETKKEELDENADSLQLAIYMYCLAKPLAEKKQAIPPLQAANIFINGKDNAGPKGGYDEILEKLLDEQVASFQKYLEKPLSDFPLGSKVYKPLVNSCKHCDFKGACRIISKYAGGKND